MAWNNQVMNEVRRFFNDAYNYNHYNRRTAKMLCFEYNNLENLRGIFREILCHIVLSAIPFTIMRVTLSVKYCKNW